MSNKLVSSTILLLFLILGASAQTKMRQVEELARDTSGWDVVKEAIRIARNKYEILPAEREKAKMALYQTQVTAHSPMGAIIYLTGGILIDDGWIRILGSGNDKLERSLPQWNKGKTFNEPGEKPQFLLVADDVIGGFFAINGGALGPELGKVYYLAPDDLKWESLHIGYSEFIDFCFVGNMDQFYDKLRWKNWRADMTGITGNKGFSIYPFTWTVEGKDIEKDSHKVVPIEEIYILETDLLKQLPPAK